MTQVESLVEKENAREHDQCAVFHDLNVPYINRKQTRNYYRGLVLNVLKGQHLQLRGADVCELGCGTGTFADFSLSNSCCSYTGVDLSEKMVELAKLKFRNERVEFVVSSLAEFSEYNTARFDLVISSSFIHHLVDLEKSMRQIRSMLKPGGIYVALHEPVLPRKHTVIENIDDALQILRGHSFGQLSLLKRTLLFFCGYWRRDEKGEIHPYFDILHHYLCFKGCIKEDQSPEDGEGKINLVDYQLNDKFSLQTCLSHMGEVIPYTYLCYIDLFKNVKLFNYEMFVMAQDKGPA